MGRKEEGATRGPGRRDLVTARKGKHERPESRGHYSSSTPDPLTHMLNNATGILRIFLENAKRQSTSPIWCIQNYGVWSSIVQTL
jgi:hypothetical protein